MNAQAHGSSDPVGAWWPTIRPDISWVTLLAGLAAGALILWAARRPSRAGTMWPLWRTWCLLAGTAAATVAVAVAVLPGLPGHLLGHILLMMVAPPLLVVGGPLRLLLRTLPPRGRRELRAILTDPALRKVTTGRKTHALLAAEYFGSMALYLVTPWSEWSEQFLAVHVMTHGYFFACGMLYWSALVGEDAWTRQATPRRPEVAAMLGAPVSLLLAALVLSPMGPETGVEAAGAAVVLAVAGSVATLFGIVVLRIRSKPVAGSRATGRAVAGRETPSQVAS